MASLNFAESFWPCCRSYRALESLSSSVKNYAIDSSHLLAVGIFGALVTLGLFFYELRGIQKCKRLITLGSELESALKIELGQFSDRPKRIAGFIGAETAGWVVYMTVLLGWLYVAFVGLQTAR